MTIPVQTQILNVIGARLLQMTTVNEYSRTIGRLERATLEPFKNGDLPALNYYPTSDSLNKKINGNEHRIFNIVIEYHDKTRDDNFSDVAYQLQSDVLIALWRDILAPKVSDQLSSALGGLVMKITLDSTTPAIGEGQSPVCGVVMALSIEYIVDPASPFILIN